MNETFNISTVQVTNEYVELTESITNATPGPVTERCNIAPSMRKFASRLDTVDFDPPFRVEGQSIGAPDGGIDVESCEGNLEDLRRSVSSGSVDRREMRERRVVEDWRI